MGFFKKYFIRGILILTPIAATFLILKSIIQTLENLLGGLLQEYFEFYIPGFGIVVLVSLIILTGVFGGNILGAKLVELWEVLLNKVPVANKIYSVIKNIVDTLSDSNNRKFSKVCLVEYPRKDIYCLAFVTNDTAIDVQGLEEKKLVNIFVPTAPNPTSGFFMMIPAADLIQIDISAEEGMNMILSGGFVIPSRARNKKSQT